MTNERGEGLVEQSLRGDQVNFIVSQFPPPPPPLTDKLLLVPNQAHFGARDFPSIH